MSIPKDKIGHFLAGCALALAGALGWVLAAKFGWIHDAASWPLASLIAALTGGAVKEYADWWDNRYVPNMHGVTFGDFFATSLPGLLILGWWLAQ